MKILLIQNDEALPEAHPKIKGMLAYIDMQFKDPIVKYDYIQEYDPNIFKEMGDAYRLNDFDFYILNFSNKCHIDHIKIQKGCVSEHIHSEDVIYVAGSATLKESWPDIKQFIKGGNK